jgi:hypothetical protein
MGIDLDDVSKYPKSVLQLYQEKKKYDAYIKKKEENIKKVEDSFHEFAQNRILTISEKRLKRGLKVGNN